MNYIRDARCAAGLTIKELGERVGCTESAISHYELDQRSPDCETLLKIADVLDTTVDYLLRGVIQKEKTTSLGGKIAEYRRDKNLSVRAFAKLANLSPTYVSYLEDGKTQRGNAPAASIETYKSIARAMKVSLSDLLDEIEEGETKESRAAIFGKNLAFFRKRANMTQKELAKSLNVSQRALASYEQGNREPSFDTLELIADFFDVKLSELLGEANDYKKAVTKIDVMDWLSTSERKTDIIDVLQKAANQLKKLEK